MGSKRKCANCGLPILPKTPWTTIEGAGGKWVPVHEECPEPEESGPVIDLMEALRKSLEGRKGEKA